MGYDLSVNSEQTNSILIKAIQNLSVDDFKHIASKGAHLNFVDEFNGKDLLNYALRSSQGDFRKKIDYGKRIDYLLGEAGFTFKKGEKYLLDAIESSNRGTNRYLNEILSNTDPNAANDRSTLFDSALLRNASSKVIDYFINNGFTYDEAKTELNTNVLISSIMNKNITTSQYQKLIDIAGEADITSKAGNQTALMVAVLKKRTDIVELLLKNGADVHRVDKSGRTVLDYIAMSRDYSAQETEQMRTLLGQYN